MKRLIYLFLLGLIIVSCSNNKEYVKGEGYIFGTSYSIIFQPKVDNVDEINDNIKNILNEVDMSLSTFNPSSTISKFNKNDEGIIADSLFSIVIDESFIINKNTKGAFDITVAPLVNAWGFGFEKSDNITNQLIDSLLNYVGMDNITFDGSYLVKSNPGIMLDASSIAKGFGVDAVANYLNRINIKNYMVEIGGEIRCKGLSHSHRKWRIGVDKPIDEKHPDIRQLQDIFKLTDVSMATSGNYRNFYIKDGKKYAHTINPHSGYPVQHSLLSATIIAPDCMTADGYATACMVMGIDKSMELIEKLHGIEGYFIYQDVDKKIKVLYTSGIKKFLVKNNNN